MNLSWKGFRNAIFVTTGGLLTSGVLNAPPAYYVEGHLDRAPDGVEVRETIEVTVAGRTRVLHVTEMRPFPAQNSPSADMPLEAPKRYSLSAAPSTAEDLLSRPEGSEVSGVFRRYHTPGVLVVQSLEDGGAQLGSAAP